MISQNDFRSSPEVEVLCNIYTLCVGGECNCFPRQAKWEVERGRGGGGGSDASVCSAGEITNKNNLSNRRLCFTWLRWPCFLLCWGLVCGEMIFLSASNGSNSAGWNNKTWPDSQATFLTLWLWCGGYPVASSVTLCRNLGHSPLSVVSSSGSRSRRVSGPGRGTWPSAWPPLLSPGSHSSPGSPVETRTNWH